MFFTFLSASSLVDGAIQSIACTRLANAALMLSTIFWICGLRRGREIFVDIGLADGVLQRVAGRVERQDVARPLLRRSRQRRSVEGEIGVAERLGQDVGLLVQLVERQPVLPVLQRLRADQRGQLRDRARNDKRRTSARCRAARRLSNAAQSIPGAFCSSCGARPHLRAVGEILALLARLVRLRDLGLEVHDPAGRALRVGIAGACRIVWM